MIQEIEKTDLPLVSSAFERAAAIRSHIAEARLSSREREIVLLIGRGYSVKAIANMLPNMQPGHEGEKLTIPGLNSRFPKMLAKLGIRPDSEISRLEQLKLLAQAAFPKPAPVSAEFAIAARERITNAKFGPRETEAVELLGDGFSISDAAKILPNLKPGHEKEFNDDRVVRSKFNMICRKLGISGPDEETRLEQIKEIVQAARQAPGPG